MQTKENLCNDCEKPIEAYRKSNVCEKCYEAFLQEELDELAEKTRSTWFIRGGKAIENRSNTVISDGIWNPL